MDILILLNHNDYEETIISGVEDAVLKEIVSEREVSSQNQNLETQTLQSDCSLFGTFPRANNSELCIQFQYVA